jgi:hypothetical protein
MQTLRQACKYARCQIVRWTIFFSENQQSSISTSYKVLEGYEPNAASLSLQHRSWVQISNRRVAVLKISSFSSVASGKHLESI